MAKNGVTALIRSQNIYNDRFVHDGLAYIDDVQADELREESRTLAQLRDT